MKLTGVNTAMIVDGDGDDGEADLVGGLQRRAIGDLPMRMWRTMFSISTMASSTRMPVTMVMASRLTRLSEKPSASMRPERRHDRQRQRDGRDHRRAPVAQEDEHDDDGEQRALDQRLHRRVVGAADVWSTWCRCWQIRRRDGACASSVDGLGDVGGDDGVARALGARDGEGDDRIAVERGEGARLGDGVGDGAELVEAHLAAARQRDHGRGEIGDRLLAGERADRLLAPADLAAAAGQIDVGRPQLAVDVAGRDAEGQQPVGIERDADLAVDAADALDLPTRPSRPAARG